MRLRLTSLYRTMAPWHPATGWMWFCAWVIGLSTWHSHGFSHGVRGFLVAVLAWAITRELAPGRAWPAILAPLLAIPFAIPSDSDVLACFAVLLAARVASRSVGDAPTRLDSLALLGMAAWAATRLAGLPAAVVLAAVTFNAAPPRRLRVVGVLALVAAIAIGSVEGTTTFRPGWDDPNTGRLVLLSATALAALLLVLVPLPRRLRVRDDRRHGPLHGARVRAARIVVVGAVVAAVGWMGTDGVFALSSASAALVAAALGGIRQRAAAPTEPGSGTISP